MMKSSFKFQIYFEEHIDVFEYYLGEGGGGGGGGGGGRRDAQRHIQNLAKHARQNFLQKSFSPQQLSQSS